MLIKQMNLNFIFYSLKVSLKPSSGSTLLIVTSIIIVYDNFYDKIQK